MIPGALEGERVDRVVAMLADVSRSLAASAIDEGHVTLDGRTVSSRSERVCADQLLEIEGELHGDVDTAVADPDVSVEYLHIDDDVLVIDKAAGQVVHPGAGNRMGTIAQGVIARFPEVSRVGEPSRPGVVHRLDKGTSGVFVMARSHLAHRSLTRQLRDRSVDRMYRTLVWGHPEARNGVVDAPIGRSVRDPTRMVVREDGKPARTIYRVEATWTDPAVALLSCVLDTGRTHQIRVHLHAIGDPVVGDQRYGGERSGVDLARPALHAAELGFTHPRTAERLEFRSPLPPDLASSLARLGDPDGR